MTNKPRLNDVAPGGPQRGSPRPRARRTSLKKVLAELAEMFRHTGSWVISGSIAMRRCGLKTFPDDIDLWCSEETLQEFASITRAPITLVETEYFRTNAVNFTLSGWSVEVVGAVSLPNGAVQTVDEKMLSHAQGDPPAEAVEDLIADYLAIDRHRPKDDRRLRTLVALNARHLDREYLLGRLREWKVRDEAVERFLRPYLDEVRAGERGDSPRG